MQQADQRPLSEHLNRPQVLGWFMVGMAVALFLMWSQARAIGGWTGLLAVGEESMLRPVIAEEIPNLVILDGEGNDGQISYAIALDLIGEELRKFVPQPAHRWRRILLPLLGSAFGTIGGSSLFWGMVTVASAGLGLASVGLRIILADLGLSPWAMLGLLAHPGVWVGLRILTPDSLGLGLGLLAIALALLRRDVPAIALLCLAVLAKEPYVLFAASLGAWMFFRRERTRGIAYFGVPLVVLVVWSIAVDQLIGGGVIEGDALSLPFMGIVEASRWWPQFTIEQNRQTYLALGLLVAGIAVALRSRSTFLRWHLWAWITLATITSEWVWRFGNGNLRAFAPIGIFGALAVADFVARSSDSHASST